MHNPTRFRSVTFGSDDLSDLNSAGGLVYEFIPQSNLNIGDIVFAHTVANTVNKSAVAADYQKFVGVVVGGDLTDMFAVTPADASLSTVVAAATAGRRVLVQTSGICLVLTGAAPAIGSLLKSDATAGRVIAAALPGDVSLIVGVALTLSAGANNLAKMLIARR